MTDPSPSGHNQERIAREAADWLTRHIARAEEASTARFERWIEADPRHLEAYERLARAWDDVGELGHLRALADPDRPFANPLTMLKQVGAQLLRPGALAGAIAGVAALVIAALFLPSLAPAPHYVTAIGEIEPVRLNDGSLVTLGARSGLDVDFSQAERAVTLREGQAFFDVARNEARPFIVRAGDVSVRVLGTRFEVRRGARETEISVEEGRVEVRLGGTVQSLGAGDRLAIAHATAPFAAAQPSPVLEVQPSHVAAWREGRLSYDDAPLREVVADLNRYYAPGIELIDPAAGAVRITASFRVDETQAFLRDLEQAFPIAATERANGRYRLSHAPH